MYLVLTLLLCPTFYQICTSNLINLDNNACRDLHHYPFKSISENCYYNPDVTAATPEMVERNGYEMESHNVVTEDGYILTVFRLTSSLEGSNEKKQPVYVEHGIFLNCDTWTFVGQRSLAYSLVDDGYDVWLGNQRGNRYSRKHKYLKYTDSEYWDFNLDITAVNDVRSVLKYIANETGMGGSIIYVGHSKGTTLIFMYASEYPEETESLLKGIIALSPIAYMDPRLPSKLYFTVTPTIGKALKAIGVQALFLNWKDRQEFFLVLCSAMPHVCEFIIYQTSGELLQFMPDDLLNFFGHFPSIAALNDLIHFSQLHNSGKFQKFDYGRRKNFEVYGQDEPPEYDLGRVKVPTYLLYGKNDVFTSKKAIQRLFDELGSETKVMLKIPVDNDEEEHQFNHNDFFYAENITTVLYAEMRKIMKEDMQPNGGSLIGLYDLFANVLGTSD